MIPALYPPIWIRAGNSIHVLFMRNLLRKMTGRESKGEGMAQKEYFAPAPSPQKPDL